MKRQYGMVNCKISTISNYYDVAHNSAGISVTLKQLNPYMVRCHILFYALKNKEIELISVH